MRIILILTDNTMDKRQVIVISGINLREGGPLTILRDCLRYLSTSDISKKYRVVALVHKKELALYTNIEYIEFPDSVGSWLKRIYYEYWKFRGLSKKLRPQLWLSLHDMTPNVVADIQAVYMHNPSIVNKIKMSDWKFNKTYILFALFYKYLYRLNIKRNTYCIVQQNWFRKAVAKVLPIPESRFIVARPNVGVNERVWKNRKKSGDNEKIFFFPAYPRPFKNFEIICEAVKLLNKRGIKGFQVILTVDVNCGKYGEWLLRQYGEISNISFVGLLNKDQMDDYYEKTDCLIFPSRLETWGLPISEFISSDRPMIIADEPYAHETAENGKKVSFFTTNNAEELAKLMEDVIKNDLSEFKPVSKQLVDGISADSYKELFKILLPE